MKLKIVLSCMWALSLIACRNQGAQMPYNKITPDNSKTETLLAINEQLTQRADSIVEAYVGQSGKKFINSELGFWYYIEQKGKGEAVAKDDRCEIAYTLRALENASSPGEIVEQVTQKIVIGKKQTIDGMEQCLKMLQHGDSATVVLPWYLAYGLKGNENVAPYTSVVCAVRIR